MQTNTLQMVIVGSKTCELEIIAEMAQKSGPNIDAALAPSELKNRYRGPELDSRKMQKLENELLKYLA